MCRVFACVVGIVVVLATASPALTAYDVYKLSSDGVNGIPDVDKGGVPPGPPPAWDLSCWEASAANLLAGAGWGLAGNTPQQNGDAIYGMLTNHFGKLQAGSCDTAINWWLLNWGYNPAMKATGYYQPTLKYNDVYVGGGPLNAGAYNFLLDQLVTGGGRYVGVTWQCDPVDHCMTLVGGNWTAAHNPAGNGTPSVWHDSDRDNPGPADDPYANQFGPNWTLPGYPTGAATSFVILSQGLQKPAVAMENYDAAYFWDRDNSGNNTQTWRVAGSANYGQPVFQGDNVTLFVPNQAVANVHKEVYLLVDYLSRNYNPENVPNIVLNDELGNVVGNPDIAVSPDGGQVMWHWTIDHQPPFEKILFPSADYFNLAGDVASFNVATVCPEPATLALLGLGGLAMLRRRRS